MERVIAYNSQKLSKTQQNYSPFKGELCAVILFIENYKYYLQHKQFILRTDSNALKWLYSLKPPTGMLGRWLEILSNYDFKIQHRPGTQHGNADSLSRAPHAPSNPEFAESVMDEKFFENEAILTAINLIEGSVSLTDSLVQMDLTLEELKLAQLGDEDIAPIYNHLINRTTPTTYEMAGWSQIAQTYGRLFDSLRVNEKGILVYKKPEVRWNVQTSVEIALWPQDLYSKLILYAHRLVAHKKVETTVREAQRVGYFYRMKDYVEHFIKACTDCQSGSGPPSAQKSQHRPAQAGFPFQRICLDHIGPLPRSKKGNEYLLTVRDVFTRWVEAFPVKNTSSTVVANVLEKEIISRYSLPESIHSDRHGGFTADKIQEICRLLNIHNSTTPAYNPKSNSVERAHRDMNAAITAMTGGQPEKWEEVLPAVLFALRITKCRITGYTPFQLLFGRDPSVPLDLLYASPPDLPVGRGYHEFAKAIKERIQKANSWARQNIDANVRRTKRSYLGKLKTFTVGQLVWLFTPAFKAGQRRKYQRRWTGPWTVTRKVNDVVFEIDPQPHWANKKSQVVSVDRLKPYVFLENRSDMPPLPDEDLSLPGDEFCETQYDPQDDAEWLPNRPEVQDPVPPDGGLLPDALLEEAEALPEIEQDETLQANESDGGSTPRESVSGSDPEFPETDTDRYDTAEESHSSSDPELQGRTGPARPARADTAFAPHLTAQQREYRLLLQQREQEELRRREQSSAREARARRRNFPERE